MTSIYRKMVCHFALPCRGSTGLSLPSLLSGSPLHRTGQLRLGTGRIRRNMVGTAMFILRFLILDGARQLSVESGVMGILNVFLRARLTVTPSRSRTFTLVASNSTGEPIRNSRTTVSPRRVVDLWLADGSTGCRCGKDRNLGNRYLGF